MNAEQSNAPVVTRGAQDLETLPAAYHTIACSVCGEALAPSDVSPEFADTCFRLLCVSARIAREDEQTGRREPARRRVRYRGART